VKKDRKEAFCPGKVLLKIESDPEDSTGGDYG